MDVPLDHVTHDGGLLQDMPSFAETRAAFHPLPVCSQHKRGREKCMEDLSGDKRHPQSNSSSEDRGGHDAAVAFGKEKSMLTRREKMNISAS